MGISGMEYEDLRASITRDVDGAAAAVDAGDLDTAQTRLEEALKTVREGLGQTVAWQEGAPDGVAWHDGTGSTFHDGTASGFHDGTGSNIVSDGA